jgi:membrane-bound serine protease (ClpP class)
MAVHPKITFFGLVLGLVVGFGLALFLLGRLTAATSLTGLVLGVMGGLAIVSFLGIAVFRALPVGRRLDGLMHQDAQPSWDGYISAAPRSDLLGHAGRAVTELRPVGAAEIDGERVDVTTEGEWLAAGTAVIVVKAEAMRVVVRRAPQITA